MVPGARLDPEVELDASALPGMPEGNRAHGHQGWLEFWRTWLIPCESFEYTPERWRDAGDRVVVELLQRGRLASGLDYATHISNIWTLWQSGRPPADVRYVGRGPRSRRA
jgi:hypothetical protein